MSVGGRRLRTWSSQEVAVARPRNTAQNNVMKGVRWRCIYSQRLFCPILRQLVPPLAHQATSSKGPRRPMKNTCVLCSLLSELKLSVTKAKHGSLDITRFLLGVGVCAFGRRRKRV
jgi:hypothetical protein